MAQELKKLNALMASSNPWKPENFLDPLPSRRGDKLVRKLNKEVGALSKKNSGNKYILLDRLAPNFADGTCQHCGPLAISSPVFSTELSLLHSKTDYLQI